MLRIQVSQMLDSVHIVYRCHHGYRDVIGHVLHVDNMDCMGEDVEQLLACLSDATTHALRRRPKIHCPDYEENFNQGYPI